MFCSPPKPCEDSTFVIKYRFYISGCFLHSESIFITFFIVSQYIAASSLSRELKSFTTQELFSLNQLRNSDRMIMRTLIWEQCTARSLCRVHPFSVYNTHIINARSLVADQFLIIQEGSDQMVHFFCARPRCFPSRISDYA
jgi:hypothetical protein